MIRILFIDVSELYCAASKKLMKLYLHYFANLMEIAPFLENVFRIFFIGARECLQRCFGFGIVPMFFRRGEKQRLTMTWIISPSI